jgi:signal transduction histidine kinase
VGVQIDRLFYHRHIADVRSSVAQSVATVSARLGGEVAKSLFLARGMSALLDEDPNMSQQTYDARARALSAGETGILNMAGAPDLVVRYVYPMGTNEKVLGFDYRQSPAQIKAVNKVLETGKEMISGPLPLIQGGEGIIIRVPVSWHKINGMEPTFWGIFSIVQDANVLFSSAGVNDPRSGIDIALRGGTGTDMIGEVFEGDSDVFANDPIWAKVPLGGNSFWVLAAVPTGGWPASAPNTYIFRGLYAAVCFLALFALMYFGRLLKARNLAKKRLHLALEAIDDEFVLFDSQDRLVLCNSKYKNSFSGMSEFIVPGVTFRQIIDEGLKRGEYPEAIGDMNEWRAKRIETHREANQTIELPQSDGRWLKIAERRTADGGTVGLRADITELRAAKDAADMASQAKSDFISNLSHELRTPLTVILGYAKLLANGSALPEVRSLRNALNDPAVQLSELSPRAESVLDRFFSLAGKVVTSAQSLISLIEDLLDFEAIENGSMRLFPEPTRIQRIFDELHDKFGPAAEEKGVRLDFEPNDIVVLADPRRLKQVFREIIGNAMKFTETGAIEVTTRVLGEMAQINVTDTGCGIPESELDKVFMPFTQVDPSSTRKKGGTGMGLAISHGIIEALEGSIGVSSELEKGTRFWIALPLAPALSDNDAQEADSQPTQLDERRRA